MYRICTETLSAIERECEVEQLNLQLQKKYYESRLQRNEDIVRFRHDLYVNARFDLQCVLSVIQCQKVMNMAQIVANFRIIKDWEVMKWGWQNLIIEKMKKSMG